MDEDAKLIEAHMKVHELMAELLEDAPPSLVAGIFQACATKIYNALFDSNNFLYVKDLACLYLKELANTL